MPEDELQAGDAQIARQAATGNPDRFGPAGPDGPNREAGAHFGPRVWRGDATLGDEGGTLVGFD